MKARSDLYSLGVVIWEMVTAHPMFRGSPAEVMYQHQHAPLQLEERFFAGGRTALPVTPQKALHASSTE
jgi:hypothetical protein